MQMSSRLTSELFLQAGLMDRFHSVNVLQLQTVELGERPVIRVLELPQLMLQCCHGPATRRYLAQIIQCRYLFLLWQPNQADHLLNLKHFHGTCRQVVLLNEN